MILFTPRVDGSIEKTTTDQYGRCVLTETIVHRPECGDISGTFVRGSREN